MLSHEVEIELTFLAASLPRQLCSATSVRVEDLYVPSDPTVYPRVRLRRAGPRFEITKKLEVTPGDASSHVESTIHLSAAEHEALVGSNTRTVSKDRYFVDLDGRPAAIDIFHGRLSGLVLVDFEFASSAELESFRAPAECLADVTQEQFIAGGYLAGRAYGDIAVDLARFGYTPLILGDDANGR